MQNYIYILDNSVTNTTLYNNDDNMSAAGRQTAAKRQHISASDLDPCVQYY